jgi:hypothetical protein
MRSPCGPLHKSVDVLGEICNGLWIGRDSLDALRLAFVKHANYVLCCLFDDWK